MKVCMVSGMASSTGGLETVVDHLAMFLINRGVPVTIFGKAESGFIKENGNYKLIGLRPSDFLPARLRFAHYHKYAFSLEVWKKIKAQNDFQIIHGHGDNVFFPSLFKGKTPLIMTFHGTMGKALTRVGPRTKPVLYTEKVAALRCDLAVACSDAVKDELVMLYGANEKKIVVIHNGVDSQKFTPLDKNQARKNLNLSQEKKFGLWVGTDPLRKGLSIAMRAIEDIPNAHLLVVGLEGKNIRNTIFCGKISEDHLIDAYRAADFLIFPTFYEGFPMVPLEAMACGLPIIVSKESNMGEIISDNIHGFIVKDKNSISYQNKIELLIKDDFLRNEMSLKCRDLAESLDWKNQAEKYWKIYQQLAED